MHPDAAWPEPPLPLWITCSRRLVGAVMSAMLRLLCKDARCPRRRPIERGSRTDVAATSLPVAHDGRPSGMILGKYDLWSLRLMDESLDDTGMGPDNADAPEVTRTGAQVVADEDLRRSLEDLSGLVVGHLGLIDTLTHVTEFAVRAIPGADGAGLTLLEAGHADTLVASTEFVREIDAIQYGIGEGPCITATAEGRTMRSGSLGGEPMWPRFGPRAGRLGVHSVLSLPLIAAENVLGAMNVYAHAKDAFDDRAAELGELFAVPAAVSVQNAQILAQTQRVAAQLQAALTSRSVIDHALGIVMSRVGCTSGEAFDRLRAISQGEHRKLSVVAQQVVDEAVRKAKARRVHDT